MVPTGTILFMFLLSILFVVTFGCHGWSSDHGGCFLGSGQNGLKTRTKRITFIGSGATSISPTRYHNTNTNTHNNNNNSISRTSRKLYNGEQSSTTIIQKWIRRLSDRSLVSNKESYNKKQQQKICSLLLSTRTISAATTILTMTAVDEDVVKQQQQELNQIQERDILSGSSTTSIKQLDRRELASKYVRLGMDQFRNGNIIESIQYYNAAETILPIISPYLWQRGISYYYNNEYYNACVQFQTDVQVNPMDVEEIVWNIASQCMYTKQQQERTEQKQKQPEQTQQNTDSMDKIKTMLSLPVGKQDPRRIMSTVYKLFRGESTEQDLFLAGQTSPSIADEFYSYLYLGLYCESCLPSTEQIKAELYMKQSLQTKYAKAMTSTNIGKQQPQPPPRDFMVSVAKVHCKLRGWDS